MPQPSSEYATTQVVIAPRRSKPTPVPPLRDRRRRISRKALVLTLLVALVAVAAIVPGVIALVNRPSRTTVLFAGTATNGLLRVRVHNSGGSPSAVEPRARLQFAEAGLAGATLKIVNVDWLEIPAKGKADLTLDLESVWISAGSTNETVARELCKASGTLQVFVRERDRWGKLHPAGEPLTIALTGRQIRETVLQRMSGEAPKGCP